MKFSKSHVTDIVWHSAKALICALQLLALHAVTLSSVGSLMNFLYVDLIIRKGSTAETVLSFIHPLTVVILFAVFWNYYDNIDDRSFRRFCDTYQEASKAPRSPPSKKTPTRCKTTNTSTRTSKMKKSFLP